MYNGLYHRNSFSHIMQHISQHSTSLHRFWNMKKPMRTSDYPLRPINCIYALDFFCRKDFTHHYVEQQHHHLHDLWSILVDFMLNGGLRRLLVEANLFEPLMLGFFLCTTYKNK
jgi:hypothetical protein